MISEIVTAVVTARIIGVIWAIVKNFRDSPTQKDIKDLKVKIRKLEKSNDRMWEDRDEIVADVADVADANSAWRTKIAETYVLKSDLPNLVRGIGKR